MLKINKITPPEFTIFNFNHECLGVANEYELLDFRVQIKKTQSTGYYIKVKDQDQIIRIDKYGSLEDYPKELNIMSDFYLELI